MPKSYIKLHLQKYYLSSLLNKDIDIKSHTYGCQIPKFKAVHYFSSLPHYSGDVLNYITPGIRVFHDNCLDIQEISCLL
jgi:hypothetical protein